MQNDKVSWLFDGFGNKVERYESTDGAIHLVVTLSERSPLSAVQVEAWYWASVGSVNFGPVEEPYEVNTAYVAGV